MNQIANLCRTTFIPSSLYAARLDCPNIPKENNNHDILCRHRCIPRKRRVLQQPYLYQQHQQWPDRDPLRPSQHASNPPQPKLLTPNICLSSTSQNLTSPPVSPKTLIPITYPSQQIPSTSASLRPCHICHRRPTTLELLDAYADCDLCSQRSCYICLRQCDSPNCCGSISLGSQFLKGGSDRLQEEINGDDSEARQTRKICSCCAVEGVTDTGLEMVQCLDCVRGQLSHWQGMPPGQG